MNNLPLDIIYRILEYSGIVKNRNGKYMNQISHHDSRYKILENINVIRILPKCTGGWILNLKPINNSGYEKTIWFNKFMCSYSNDEPLISNNIDEFMRYYNFSQQGYCYCWTIYHRNIVGNSNTT